MFNHIRSVPCDAHWRSLADMIEPFVCGGAAAL